MTNYKAIQPKSSPKILLAFARLLLMICIALLSSTLIVNTLVNLFLLNSFGANLPTILASTATFILIPILLFLLLLHARQLIRARLSQPALPKISSKATKLYGIVVMLLSVSSLFLVPVNMYIDAHFAPLWLYLFDFMVIATVVCSAFLMNTKTIFRVHFGIAVATILLMFYSSHHFRPGYSLRMSWEGNGQVTK